MTHIAKCFRHHVGEDNYDNRVIRAVDYFSQRNAVDNANIIDITGQSGSNVINANSISGRGGQGSAISNPLAPSFNDLSNINHDYSGYVDEGSPQATITDFDSSAQQSESYSNDNYDVSQTTDVYNGANVESGGNVNAANVDGNNLNVVSNSSSSSVGISSNPVSGSEAASSAGESQSVSKKAYEIEEMTKEDKFIPSVFLVVIVLVLLIVGYKRKSEDIE